jgi:flagellar protein FliS
MTVKTALKAYTHVGIETNVGAADSHKLISMLYQGALLAIANAKNGMLRNDIPVKGKATSHAIRIINEGLKASLDKNVGGKLAQDLDALYDYMCLRLAEASLKNDIGMLDEVTALINEIKVAWDSIRPASNVPLSSMPQPVAPNKHASLVYGRG